METFELRYFLAAARRENMHRAAEDLSISPGAVSKAVSRLESELGVPLFARHGRNVRLTEHGLLLQRRARQILALEESARVEISGGKGVFPLTVAGVESVLLPDAPALVDRVRPALPRGVRVTLQTAPDDGAAIALVRSGEAHLALVTSSVPAGFESFPVRTALSRTCVGPGHPLHAEARTEEPVPVETLLAHGFACPTAGMLGRVEGRVSPDGWRDDLFPRRVEYVCSTLALLRAIVGAGRAVAYLPDPLVASLGFASLRVSGCSATCRTTVRAVARDREETPWLAGLFSPAAEARK